MLSVVMLKVKAPFGWLLTGSRKDGEKSFFEKRRREKKKIQMALLSLSQTFL